MMKKDKKVLSGLLFSVVLLGAVIYWTDSSLIKGAAPSNGAPITVVPPAATNTSTSSTPVVAATPDTAADAVAATTDNGATSSESSQPQSSTTVESQPQQTSEPAPVAGDIYTVNQGETLWDISQETGVQLQTLMNDNQLRTGAILEGQELLVRD